MGTIGIVQGPGQSLFEPGTGTVLIINTDTSNTVWISPQPSVHATDTPVPPGASVTLDGTIRYYADTLAKVGVVDVSVFPGGIAYSPGPPILQASGALDTGSTTAVMFTFPAPGRIWGAQLSYAAGSNASYSGGTQNIEAYVAAGIDLVQVVNMITAPGQVSVSNAAATFPGIPVNRGQVVALGTPVTIPPDAFQTACGIVFYSIP